MTQRFDHGKANADFVRVDAARVEEFGAVCAFFHSVYVGYVTAQNIRSMAGATPGYSEHESRSAELFGRIAEEPAGDDQPVDLAGALEDVEDARVAEPFLGQELLG
jgi:hypothetical protein